MSPMPFKLLLSALLMFALSQAGANSPETAPAPGKAAQRFLVEARIRLDGALLGSPSATVEPGKEFALVLGKEGSQRVTLTGMTAPINERSVALDFTLELEQWGKLGIASRRVSQTVKLAPGERYLVDGIKDPDGKPFGMDISVRAVTR
ncbi:MAG: hypothetical protein SF172_13325 [Burkholderiales bacterium]|nr:hypothetical protein [Burkholderiales bacterium]